MKKNKVIDLKFMQSVFKVALNNNTKIILSSKFEKVKGWDSLGHMKIISEIEKKLSISFEIDEIIGINTVKKLIELTKKKVM
ncbi:acyl carrier protein [Candidatus Pelagibacter sp. HIMB1485]|uniref:acyl carrier protein n=1 Tax=Candidatus Pelagibacter sp. HIMB1485 TaxID=3415415 RepID=UPI003F879AD1